jgi:LysR family nod box-dependent transcriptional activator
MRFQKLDLNLLVALDALLSDPHVTRAAERLNVTQSAVSGSLARLREYFADELIVQAGRRMELTSLASELREPVHDLLARADRLIATRSSFDPATSDRCFTMSCTDYVWATLMQDVVEKLISMAPSVRVDYAGSTQDFTERRIELLIIAERFALPAFPSLTLFADPMVCIAWTGNEAIGSTLSEAEYFALQHVVAYSSRPLFIDDWIERNCAKQCKVAARVPNYSLIPKSVVGTPFIATVPLRMAKTYARHLPIRILPPPLEFPSLVEVLQWHPHRDADNGLRWFRELIMEASLQLQPDA